MYAGLHNVSFPNEPHRGLGSATLYAAGFGVRSTRLLPRIVPRITPTKNDDPCRKLTLFIVSCNRCNLPSRDDNPKNGALTLDLIFFCDSNYGRDKS